MKKILNFIDKYSSKDDTYTFKLFGRPLAHLLSLILVRYVTANQVTYFRTIFTIIALALMIFDQNILFSIGIILFLLLNVLDAVDGEIARIKDSASFWGKFLDGYVDNTSYALLPFVFAINLLLNDITFINVILIILLFSSSLLYLLECFFRERLVFYREWILKENFNLKENKFFKTKLNSYFANSFYDLTHLLLVGVLIFMSIEVFFMCIVLLYFYVTIIRIILLFISASNHLRVHRKSRFKTAQDTLSDE